MAKKTTKTDAPRPKSEKEISSTKPARGAVAKLAGSVKKKIKAVLEPKAPKGNGASPLPEPAAPAPTDLATPAKRKTREAGTSAPPRKAARSSSGSKRIGASQGDGSRPALLFTSEDIALRAYFLAQRRNETGEDGSPEGDWIEAERQLAAESGQSLVHS